MEIIWLVGMPLRPSLFRELVALQLLLHVVGKRLETRPTHDRYVAPGEKYAKSSSISAGVVHSGVAGGGPERWPVCLGRPCPGNKSDATWLLRRIGCRIHMLR